MSAGTYYLGVLCATYFVSRAIAFSAEALLSKRGRHQRIASTHLASAGLLAGVILAARPYSPAEIVPYIAIQAAWWVMDAVRTYRPPTRSRVTNPLRWRYTGRATAALMVVAALGYCGAIYASFTGSLSFLGAVPIAASHADVLYASGKPAMARHAGDVSFAPGGDIFKSESWLYASPPTRVDFDPSTGLSSLAECVRPIREDQGSCPTAFGLGIGSFDWQVANRLGTPTSVAIGLGTRLIRYPELGLDFLLEQYRVRSIRVYRRNDDYRRKIWRLIRYAIP